MTRSDPLTHEAASEAETKRDLAWLVSEDAIERDIRRAAKASRKSDGSLWVAGYFAARVLGTYKVNAVLDIAFEAGRSQSAVENWSHAYALYNELRRFGVASAELRRIRKALTMTHFSTAWELRRKYDLSYKKVMHYLKQMLDYRTNQQPYSVDALRQEVEAHENQSGNTPSFAYYHKRLGTIITGALAAKDTPREWRKWLAAVPQRGGQEAE